MTKDEAIDKVRALLALANSTNEHEAANAAAAAAGIMARHRIEADMLIEAERADDECAEAFEMNADLAAEREHERMPSWYWALAWGIADANGCRPWPRWLPTKLASAGLHRAQRVTFVGRPADAAASRYMLDAIANEVDRLAVEYVKRHPGGRSRALGKAFRLGCSQTIARRLRTVARETADVVRRELAAAGDTAGIARLETALVRQGSDAGALDAFLASGGVKYGTPRAPTFSSRDGFAAGKVAGESVRLTGGSAALNAGARALGKGRG